MSNLHTKPGYSQVNLAVHSIIDNMEGDNFQPDVVIGLARGGLIMAVIISHMLRTPMRCVEFSSKQGNGDDRVYTNFVPEITGEMCSGTGEAPKLPKLLIVDDICDSGYTMLELTSVYQKRGHELRTASMYYREGSVFTPSYIFHSLKNIDPWVIFPWEIGGQL